VFGSLRLRAFVDENDDGIYQPAEPLLPDVQIALSRDDGPAVDCVTGANGLCQFDVPPGLYSYEETTVPMGWVAQAPTGSVQVSAQQLLQVDLPHARVTATETPTPPARQTWLPIIMRGPNTR